MTTSPTSTTYQADEHLAQHLLELGFTDTTGSAYHRARGWRSFYHLERGLSVWLQPDRIVLTLGAHWRFEAHGTVLAETLDFLLTATRPNWPAPTPERPSPLPPLGYEHQFTVTNPTAHSKLPPLAN